MQENWPRHAQEAMVEAGALLQEVAEAVVGLSTTATEEEWEQQRLEAGEEGEGALGGLVMEVVEEPHSQVEAEAEAGLLGLQQKEGAARELVAVAARLTKTAEAELVLLWPVVG